MTDIPSWWMKGDWFDACSCNVPCPCGFAQAPTNNHCEGVMAYHIREGCLRGYQGRWLQRDLGPDVRRERVGQRE